MTSRLPCSSAVALAVLVAGTSIAPPAHAAAQQPDRAIFTVGTASAARGVSATGVLAVPAGSDSALAIPVALIHGAHPGPVVAFIAGTHATEYATIIAMQRLIPRVDPARLSGTVIIVPVVNIPSFTSMTPIRNPVDNKTTVGGYPGDSAGTQSQRAMAMLVKEVVAQADAVVDFHGGDLDEDVGGPFSAAMRGGRPKVDSLSLRLALAFGYNHVQIVDRDASSPRVGGTLAGQALIRGEGIILVGTGRSGTVTPADLAGVVNGSLGLLGAMHMISDAPKPVRKPLFLDGSGGRIAATQSAVWFGTAKANTMVRKGDKLGYYTDFLGNRIGEVVAPNDGLLVYIHGVPSMRRGVVLAEVQPVLPAIPAWKAPVPVARPQ